MSDYTKSTNFASKDSLASGNPLKIVKGTEIDTEFNNIATSIATKADLSSPAFTGAPTAPTAAYGTNTLQVATTAFVATAVGALGTISTQNANNVSISGGTINGAVIGGTTPAAITGTTISGSTFATTNWTVTESGGVLYFKYGGVNKMKLDSSGNITVSGNVTAYGTV